MATHRTQGDVVAAPPGASSSAGGWPHTSSRPRRRCYELTLLEGISEDEDWMI